MRPGKPGCMGAFFAQIRSGRNCFPQSLSGEFSKFGKEMDKLAKYTKTMVQFGN
jgi:hypothetical protein